MKGPPIQGFFFQKNVRSTQCFWSLISQQGNLWNKPCHIYLGCRCIIPPPSIDAAMCIYGFAFYDLRVFIANTSFPTWRSVLIPWRFCPFVMVFLTYLQESWCLLSCWSEFVTLKSALEFKVGLHSAQKGQKIYLGPQFCNFSVMFALYQNNSGEAYAERLACFQFDQRNGCTHVPPPHL